VHEYKAEDARIAGVVTEEASKLQTQHRKVRSIMQIYANHSQLINELAHSELPAELIVDKQRKTNIEQRQVRQAMEEAQEENIAKRACQSIESINRIGNRAEEAQAKARRTGVRGKIVRDEDVEPYTFFMCDTNLSSAPTE